MYYVKACFCCIIYSAFFLCFVFVQLQSSENKQKNVGDFVDEPLQDSANGVVEKFKETCMPLQIASVVQTLSDIVQMLMIVQPFYVFFNNYMSLACSVK